MGCFGLMRRAYWMNFISPPLDPLPQVYTVLYYGLQLCMIYGAQYIVPTYVSEQ